METAFKKFKRRKTDIADLFPGLASDEKDKRTNKEPFNEQLDSYQKTSILEANNWQWESCLFITPRTFVHDEWYVWKLLPR